MFKIGKITYCPLALVKSAFKNQRVFCICICISWINNAQSDNYLHFGSIAVLWSIYWTDVNSTSFHGSLTQTLIKYCGMCAMGSCNDWNAKCVRKSKAIT